MTGFEVVLLNGRVQWGPGLTRASAREGTGRSWFAKLVINRPRGRWCVLRVPVVEVLETERVQRT